MKKEGKNIELMQFLRKQNTILVFDIDGVLAPFEYGVHCHNACLDSEWNSYIQIHDVYGETRPVKTLQELIRQKNNDCIFVCSQADENEKPRKIKFVTDHYGILKNHIYFVKHSLEKLDCLKAIHQNWFPQGRPEQIVLIEDTVKTLNYVQENSRFSTVHISSFLK